MSGRPVPPHGSGGQYVPQAHERRTCLDWRRDDPDETMGRVLFRRDADAEARQSVALSRRVRLVSSEAPMERVGDKVRPVIAHLLDGPVAGPWANEDARWDAVSDAWQAYADPLCDEAGLIDFTELGAVVQIAVNKALALATTAPEAGAVGTTVGREQKSPTTREDADR